MRVIYGSYTGDGVDGRTVAIDAGGTPKFIFVHGPSNQRAYRFDLGGTRSWYESSGGAAGAEDAIKGLSATEITLGTNVVVNALGTVYYWTALVDTGDGDIVTGSYTGNGAGTRSITASLGGGTPSFVLVKSSVTGNRPGKWRSSTMSTDQSLSINVEGSGSQIRSFAADAFTVSSAVEVNNSGEVYYWVAALAVSGVLGVLSYTGDGVDNRDISGLGFEPDVVHTQHYGTSYFPYWRTADMSSAFAARGGGANANAIQALQSDGFQLGTDNGVNASGGTYHALCLRDSLVLLTPTTASDTDTGAEAVVDVTLNVGGASPTTTSAEAVVGITIGIGGEASVTLTASAIIATPYRDWLALDAASCIVLAEAQPAEILRGWTATSGRPNTYEVTWSPFAQAALVGGGGVYRRLDSVEVDGVDLTERASVADVDANLGSWYYDEAAELLYVSLNPAADPDSGADVVLAEFTIFVATEPKDFVGGQLYEPKLTGTLPTVRAESDDPLFGVKTYPGGTFEVANADGFFDALTRDWVWRNRPVTFYLGGSTMDRDDYAAIATVVIEDMAPNDRVCRFRVRAAASALDQQIPPNVYDSTVSSTLGEGVSGTYRPLLYGAVSDIPAPLVDNTPGAQVYEVADPTLQVLTAVSSVVAVSRSDGSRTTLTLTTDYTVDLTGCRVTVVSKVATPSAPTVSAQGTTGATAYSYKIVARNELGTTVASAAGTIANGNATLSPANFNRVTWAAVPGAESYDVYGRTGGSEQLLASEIRATTWDDDGTLTPSGAQPSTGTAYRYTDGTHEIRVTATGETDGAGGYLSTGGEILLHLLDVLGVPSGSITTADFSTADTDAPYPLGRWIRERKAAAQYIRIVEASNLASLFVDAEGMWRYRIWAPTGDSTGLTALQDEDFVSWEPDARIESLFAEVHARYSTNPATKEALVAKAENPVVRYAYRERGILQLETALLSASHAEVIAQRVLLIAGSPSIEVRVRERGLASMTLNVRDRVSVTRARGPVSGGALEGVVMDVLEIEKTLGPPGVALRLGDLWGLTARIGTIVDAAAPAWTSATDAERNVSGFITDANGLADSSDPTSADHSIFW